MNGPESSSSTSRSLPRAAWEFVFVVGVSSFYALSLFFTRWEYQASTDSNYHWAVARAMAVGDLVSEKSNHLPWTILEDMPVDHYFGYHLLLAVFAWIEPGIGGLKAATLFFFLLVPLSVWAFLRAQGVRYAWAWAFVPLLLSNQDWRYLMLRGGHWLAPLSVLFLYLSCFVERTLVRRIGVVAISYVGILSYQGALILLPFHAACLVSLWVFARFEVRGSRLLEVGLTAFGLLLGLLANPYMDAKASTFRYLWLHVGYMNLDPDGLYPGLREFGPLPFELLAANPIYWAFPLAVLAVGGWLLWGERKANRIEAILLGAALVGLVLTARAIRMREYSVPWSTLFLAVVLSRRLEFRALPDAIKSGTFALLIALALFIKWPDTHFLLGTHLPSTQYEGAESLLAESDSPILNIAEGDYTTLRFAAPEVRAVWGLNHYFLYFNRPVFNDVMTLRKSRGVDERLRALRRFRERGVSLVAVQHRHPFYAFALSQPAALEEVYRREFPGFVSLTGASIFRLRSR